MVIAFVSLFAVVFGAFIFNRARQQLHRKKPLIFSLVLILLGIAGLLSRSFVVISPNGVGHMMRIYTGSNMRAGQVVALPGQKGPQARILPPGFHFIFLVNVLYKIEEKDIINIPEGYYGLLVAKDGLPLRKNQFLADGWDDNKTNQMLDATYFLSEGKGQKGPQLTVLKPGQYRINQYLFDVTKMQAMDVKTGHVAVIRSNVQTLKSCPKSALLDRGEAGKNLSSPVVSKGCVGVWDEALPPGRYYLNNRAYVATIIPTRVQTWSYQGGYTHRKINLIVEDDGTIKQKVEAFRIITPKTAADKAINVRVEGWTFPVDMRVTIQVHPQDASKVVASVGTLQAVEDNIITPAIRDILRTIGGQPDIKVLDFIEKRDHITSLVEKSIIKEGKKAGVTIQEVRMGEPAIPPELLVARIRKQLAAQLQDTYKQEQQAQKERIKVERERATASQQSTLVTAEIAKKAAEYRKEQKRLEGEGEKLRLIEIAQGQKAQTDILGADRVLQLQILKEVLAVAAKNPDIIKVPQVQVNNGGQGGSLEGAAAILGASNLVKMLNNTGAKPISTP